METVVSAVDADLRRYYALIMESGTEAMKASVRGEVAARADNFAQFREVQEVLSEFIAQNRGELHSGRSGDHGVLASAGYLTRVR